MSLTEKYRPRCLDDLVGQNEVVASLGSFVANPSPTAFIFSGDTGTGKTSAAMALANDLGCAVEHAEFGGLFQVASGEQSADTVRQLSKNLWQTPFIGSGWKVWVINEADRMHAQAEAVWLDVLESLPARTVVVFTTNEASKLSARFRDRCLSLQFVSDRAALDSAVQSLVDRVWQGETGLRGSVDCSELPGIVGNDGKVSFRRAVQAIGKALLLRQPLAMKTATPPAPVIREPMFAARSNAIPPEPKSDSPMASSLRAELQLLRDGRLFQPA